MSPDDNLRGAYNEFLKSPTGKDFLTRLVAMETQLRAETDRADASAEKKVTNTDKMNTLYWVRTLLDDLSKPKPTSPVRSKNTPLAS